MRTANTTVSRPGTRPPSIACASGKLGSEQGNAVAIVLLVLAIITLLGMGLMTQSKIDGKFVAAYKSYDSMFNLADAGAQLAYRYMRDFVKEAPKDFKPPGLSKPIPGYEYPQYIKTDGKSIAVKDYDAASDTEKQATLKQAGSFQPTMVYLGQDTSGKTMGGWGLGGWTEFWISQGVGRRQEYDPTTTKVVDLGTKEKRQPAETSVQIAVIRTIPSPN